MSCGVRHPAPGGRGEQFSAAEGFLRCVVRPGPASTDSRVRETTTYRAAALSASSELEILRMRRLALFAGAAAITLFASTGSAQTKVVNYAGKWIVVDSATLGRGGRGGLGPTVTIVQD